MSAPPKTADDDSDELSEAFAVFREEIESDDDDDAEEIDSDDVEV